MSARSSALFSKMFSKFVHPATEHHQTTLNFAEQMFSVAQSKCSVRLTGALIVLMDLLLMSNTNVSHPQLSTVQVTEDLSNTFLQYVSNKSKFISILIP